MTTPLTEQQLAHWKRRALQAEAAVGLALWMRPLTPGGQSRITGDPETAEQLCQRLRQNIESLYPHLIVRHQHQKTEVFQIADGCGCDPNAGDYDDEHSESSDEGEDLCTKQRLGFICDSCRSEDGDGPAWKPYAVEWPCPPIAALDQTPTGTAAPAPSVAPLAASQPSEARGEGETATRPPTGRTGNPRRTLTPNEYDAAWHAVEGAAGEEGADPGTVLHAVLNRLGIEWQDAARPAAAADVQPQPAV